MQLLSCREMLRLKRSVAASYSQIHYNTSIVEAATTPAATGDMPLPVSNNHVNNDAAID